MRETRLLRIKSFKEEKGQITCSLLLGGSQPTAHNMAASSFMRTGGVAHADTPILYPTVMLRMFSRLFVASTHRISQSEGNFETPWSNDTSDSVTQWNRMTMETGLWKCSKAILRESSRATAKGTDASQERGWGALALKVWGCPLLS